MCSATPAKDPARQCDEKERGEVAASHSSHSRSSGNSGVEGGGCVASESDGADAMMAKSHTNQLK